MLLPGREPRGWSRPNTGSSDAWSLLLLHRGASGACSSFDTLLSRGPHRHIRRERCANQLDMGRTDEGRMASHGHRCWIRIAAESRGEVLELWSEVGSIKNQMS